VRNVAGFEQKRDDANGLPRMLVCVTPEISDPQEQSNCEDEPKRRCHSAEAYFHIVNADIRCAGKSKMIRSPANSRCITSRSQSLSLPTKLEMLHYTSGAGDAARALAACRNFARTTAMRKKKPGIRIEKEARRRARAGIGMPPAARLIPDKRNKPPKHKKTPLDSGRA
jgi:hypothetical protein